MKIVAYEPYSYKVIEVYDSVKDGAHAFRVNPSAITQALQGKCQFAAGARWGYYGQEPSIPPEKTTAYDTIMRPVMRVDQKGNREKFDNATLASNRTPYTTPASVVACCKGEKYTTGKYRFFFIEEVNNDKDNSL